MKPEQETLDFNKLDQLTENSTEIKELPLVDSILEKVDVVGLSGLGGPEKMKKKLAENLAIHQAVIDFVNEHFVEGIDYGKATAAGTKPELLLPGAEKLVYAFDTHPEWYNDRETWEMLGKPTTTVFLICKIVDNSTRKVIGEGRGACTVGEKFGQQAARDINGSIKIGKKRSLVDAAKGTFMLSGRFAQDVGEIKSFIDLKKSLFEFIQQQRKGINSTLNDNQFSMKVCEREIHKKMMTTLNEIKIVFKALNENKYELETGDRFPD